MLLFDETSNKLITYGMKRWKNRHNRFVKISKLVPKYTPKQIASHWKNYLDPSLCLDTLEFEEKKFIIKWIREHRTVTGVIHWKYVIKDLKIQFGKQHSENKIKNYWNSRKKSYLRKLKGLKVRKDERKFIFHHVNSDELLIPKNQNGYSKISISFLLNYDN
ncbi:363_t:CDS:2 [Rhizophagus irregularis]|nr:363_t:CDS:2 [Rhizophagus irregularis]